MFNNPGFLEHGSTILEGWSSAIIKRTFLVGLQPIPAQGVLAALCNRDARCSTPALGNHPTGFLKSPLRGLFAQAPLCKPRLLLADSSPSWLMPHSERAGVGHNCFLCLRFYCCAQVQLWLPLKTANVF